MSAEERPAGEVRRPVAGGPVSGKAAAGLHPPSTLVVWLMAIRPRTLTAAVAPVILGTAIAGARGAMAIGPAAAALVGALLIQVATNLANDYFDFMKGGDRGGRVGPTRVVQAGLLAPNTVMRAVVLVVGLATLVGAYLVWVGGPGILVVGVFSLVCAIAYTGGPFPLAYHGLGDVFVFVFFGLVAVGGTYWVQARALPPDLLLAGAGVGAVTTAILVVNNLRDIVTDEEAGKRTLAVRLGRRGTRIEYLVLLVGAAVVPIVGVAMAGWPAWVLIGIVGLGPAARGAVTVFSYRQPTELNGALAATAQGVAGYAALLSLGFLLGS